MLVNLEHLSLTLKGMGVMIPKRETEFLSESSFFLVSLEAQASCFRLLCISVDRTIKFVRGNGFSHKNIKLSSQK